MFDRFNERARKVIILAQDEASRFEHSYIGTEHLLAGLIREERGVGARTLGALGVSLDGVRSQIGVLVGRGVTSSFGQAPFSSNAKKAIEGALFEAAQLGDTHIGTEHLLLGLSRTDSVGYRILKNLGPGGGMPSIEAVRREVIRLLQSGSVRDEASGKKKEPEPIPRLRLYNLIDRGPLRITARVHDQKRLYGEKRVRDRLLINALLGSNRVASVDIRLPALKFDFSHWHKRKYQMTGKVRGTSTLARKPGMTRKGAGPGWDKRSSGKNVY